MRTFSLWVVGITAIADPVWALRIAPSNLVKWLLPQLLLVPSQVGSGQPSAGSLESPTCAALPSPYLYPAFSALLEVATGTDHFKTGVTNSASPTETCSPLFRGHGYASPHGSEFSAKFPKKKISISSWVNYLMGPGGWITSMVVCKEES